MGSQEVETNRRQSEQRLNARLAAQMSVPRCSLHGVALSQANRFRDVLSSKLLISVCGRGGLSSNVGHVGPGPELQGECLIVFFIISDRSTESRTESVRLLRYERCMKPDSFTTLQVQC